jgi:hypothetical protein
VLFVVHFFAIKAETGGAELHDLSLRCFVPALKAGAPNQAQRRSVKSIVVAELLQA